MDDILLHGRNASSQNSADPAVVGVESPVEAHATQGHQPECADEQGARRHRPGLERQTGDVT